MKLFLLADDSQAKIMMLKPMIEKSGIADSLLIAKNTEEAKELIDQHAFSFAFIDYEMPSENGPAVIAYLRAKQPDALIALQTSANSEEYKQDGFAAGATEFICTTLPMDEVVQKIEDVLSSWKALST